MTSYLRRLLRAGAAYQLADAVSKLLALALLPVYTRHLTRADYGTAELLLTTIILVSIVPAGSGSARRSCAFTILDADRERRLRLARTATGTLLITTTVLAGAAALAAEPVSRLLLGAEHPAELRAAALGLWAFTNLELAYALLRVEERAGAFALASLCNVALTVALTLWLVVGRGEGALGLLLGNYAASAVVLVGLWLAQRDAFGLRRGGIGRAELGARCCASGCRPCPPRSRCSRSSSSTGCGSTASRAPATPGLYSLSVKLAGVVVFTVRAFQYAWPPLAYSIADDAEAARVYARIATYYVLFTGVVVAGLAAARPLARAAVRRAEVLRGARGAAVGRARLGAVRAVPRARGDGRAGAVSRFATRPPRSAGSPSTSRCSRCSCRRSGSPARGSRWSGAYAVMLVVMWALTRGLFAVAFEWGRLARLVAVAGGGAAGGELLAARRPAPPGSSTRALVLAAIGPGLWAAGFFRPGELAAAVQLLRVGRRAVPSPGGG